jgi:Streptomyces sporulation and cell division protein, SsgA
MEIAPAVVRALTLELIDESGTGMPLAAELRYDTSDPYAVAALFQVGDTMVRWVFSRDLLAEGLYEPAGDGDVHIWPYLDARGSAVVIVELSSPDGEALLQARSHEVSDFLAQTREIIPVGAEGRHLDLDEVVTALLAGAPDTV